MARPEFIVWVRDYYDERNRKLRERVIVSGEAPPGFARFVAEGTVTLGFEDAEGQKTATRKYAAPIAADSVDEAFELLNSELARRGEEAKREIVAEIEQQARKIVLPGPGNKPGPPPRGRNGPHRRDRR